MTVASCLTARLMESWAHGQDIADALGVTRVPTARLSHVAFLCVRAVPTVLPPEAWPLLAPRSGPSWLAPDGRCWDFGPPDALDVVRGSAVDLCLVATQRRHRDDTSLVATGPSADQWLAVAQAFAARRGPVARPPARRSERGTRAVRIANCSGF